MPELRRRSGGTFLPPDSTPTTSQVPFSRSASLTSAAGVLGGAGGVAGAVPGETGPAVQPPRRTSPAVRRRMGAPRRSPNGGWLEVAYRYVACFNYCTDYYAKSAAILMAEKAIYSLLG